MNLLPTQEPALMGILNVTPNSFSDGGQFIKKETAFLHARKLYQDGAHIIDIGGESTRPGSDGISIQEELDRIIPIVEYVKHNLDVKISLDTTKPEVLHEAVKIGIHILNDVSSGKNTKLMEIAALHKLTILIMHAQGSPSTMQVNPVYSPKGVVNDILEFFQDKILELKSLFNVPSSSIWIDPGIGFGKTLEHNLSLLKHISAFSQIGHICVVGASRKSFISKVMKNEELSPMRREPGTLAASLWCIQNGVRVLRVHDVEGTKQAIQVWHAIENGNKI